MGGNRQFEVDLPTPPGEAMIVTAPRMIRPGAIHGRAGRATSSGRSRNTMCLTTESTSVENTSAGGSTLTPANSAAGAKAPGWRVP